MTTITVKCRCPKGHTIQSSFKRKDFNIENEKINKNLIGQKIQDYCKQCKRVEILYIFDIIQMER